MSEQTLLHYDDVTRMLRGAAARVKEHRDLLSKLDSFGGDGDHGSTMARAMDHLEKVLAQEGAPAIERLLHDVGWAILGVDGGATGPLFGTLFMAMGEAAAGRDALNAAGLAELFESGLAGVRKRTRAQVGDKTMMDALAPAVEALRAAADAGSGPVEALARGAEAAERGAEATRALQARFGRAKNLKEKSIGEPDPGATSVSLLFRGFAEGVETHA